MVQIARNLDQFQTTHIQTLQSRSAGYSETIRLEIQGNSLLSSVFVKSVTGSPTLDVRYYETTSGLPPDERRDIPAHPTITAPNVEPDQKLLTAFHNRVYCEIEVGGTGTIEFGVYITVVMSFASLLDQALKGHLEPTDLSTDEGLPFSLYDPSDGKWYLAKGKQGCLTVDGTVTAFENPMTERQYGTNLIADDVTATLVSYNPTSDKKLFRVLVGGDGYGEFYVKINGVLWATLRNSWNDRSVTLQLDGKSLSSSDTITVEAKHVSLSGSGSCNFEAYVYLGEA